MRIAYIHGFASSAMSGTVGVLRKYFPDDEVFAYDVPVEPAEALRFLEKKLRADKVDVVFGTSLGAYYAIQLKGFLKVALNPPFDPNRVLDQFLNTKVEFLNPRKHGEKTFKWTDRQHDQIAVLNKNIVHADAAAKRDVKLLFARDDGFVTDRADFDDSWNKIFIKGGHRCTEEMFTEYIMPIIEDYRLRLDGNVSDAECDEDAEDYFDIMDLELIIPDLHVSSMVEDRLVDLYGVRNYKVEDIPEELCISRDINEDWTESTAVISREHMEEVLKALYEDKDFSKELSLILEMAGDEFRIACF